MAAMDSAARTPRLHLRPEGEAARHVDSIRRPDGPPELSPAAARVLARIIQDLAAPIRDDRVA
jgi:hypothetical protein